MTAQSRLIFVILAYNEEHNIGRLLSKLLALQDDHQRLKVIVVDDGSRDRTKVVTRAFADRMDVEVVSHPTNLGVGQGFRSGFAAALRDAAPDDVIVTVEADNTSDLAILRQMLAQVEGGSDLSLASCYAPGGEVLGTTPSRMLYSKAANLLVKYVCGLHGIHTSSSFYRAYRATALERAVDWYGDDLIEEPGFVCMVEVLVKLHRLGLRITEVPMVLDGSQRVGTSKMRVFRTMRGYARFVLRDLARRVRGKAPRSAARALSRVG